MKLRPRLKVIAEMLPRCSLICDIGTDHAYLPIYLLKNHICKRAVITEISQGPLNTAYKNVSKENVENNIEAILGNGLNALICSKCLKESKDGDYVVIIAGMGGSLMVKIINDGIHYAKKAKTLILQPMSRIEIVTEWLINQGFEIYNQRLVKDDNRIYNVLAVKWTGIQKKYNTVDLYIGKKLIDEEDPLLKEYINWKISIIDKIIANLSNYKDTSDSKNNSGNFAALLELKKDMLNILNIFDKQRGE